MSARILVVDDVANARTALAELLRHEGYEVETASDGLDAIARFDAFSPRVVITDLQMPGMDGIALVKYLRGTEDPPSVVVVTAFAAVDTAIEAMRAGAEDYLTKPVSFDALLVVLHKVLENDALRREARQLRERLRERKSPSDIIGTSPAMQRMFEIIDQVAPSRATVLITGETGTGKELVASAIHQRSPRASGPFVKLDCAALADSLLESELFGHEKGAFTGATAMKQGRLELAAGGTLFLDEIGDISPTIQVKLLRFLQEHELERVGGGKPIHVDVRIIAATHRDLEEEVARGRFREDLYYRLDVVVVTTPPLRDRRSDIPALARHFLDHYAKLDNRRVDSISPQALQLLVAYAWPGNVRELEHAIERALVLAKGTEIEARHLPASVGPDGVTGVPPVPGSKLAALERYAILETMKAVGGSTSKAALMLGISPRTIQYRLHEYNAAPRSDIEVVRKQDTVLVTAGRAKR